MFHSFLVLFFLFEIQHTTKKKPINICNTFFGSSWLSNQHFLIEVSFHLFVKFIYFSVNISPFKCKNCFAIKKWKQYLWAKCKNLWIQHKSLAELLFFHFFFFKRHDDWLEHIFPINRKISIKFLLLIAKSRKKENMNISTKKTNI